MVAAAAREAKPGEWILGRGFHQAKWDNAPSPNVLGFPVHETLSKVSPRNPVWLTHASGHAGFANAEALRLAGVGKNTADPPGGQIFRDAQGNPTGLLNEQAQGLVNRALASYRSHLGTAESTAEARKQVELAERECLSKGITTFEDAGSPMATIDLFKSLTGEGKLDLRLWVMLRQANAQIAPKLRDYYIEGAGDQHLTVRAIKRQIDGALGSRGALLLEPYSDLAEDAPNRSGLHTEDPADIRRTAELAIANGFQLCVHAIGDRANREVLDLYEAVFKEHPEKDRTRAALECGRHPAFRCAGCDCRDARDSLHFRCTLRAGAAGTQARGGRRVRLAEAHEVRRGSVERDRHASGRRGSHRVVLCVGEPETEGRLSVFSGPTHEPDGGAAVVHREQCLCGV
jgi:predicted amidohydrolase YtcJ